MACNWATFVFPSIASDEMFPNWRSKQINERNFKSDNQTDNAIPRIVLHRLSSSSYYYTPPDDDNEAEMIGKIIINLIRIEINFFSMCSTSGGGRRCLQSVGESFMGI